MIPFNKPSIVGKELEYIRESINLGKISGDGKFTNLCQSFFQERYCFRKVLLTTSCTDALEMAAILLDIKDGDEVIIPSFTFVSTANAFALRGAKITFVDSEISHPNMKVNDIEPLITSKTKALVVVHYAGVSVNMQEIKRLAEKYGLYIVEDAAQAVDSYFKDENGDSLPLGSIGHLAAFSFHETKNVICGEGGMLVVNDPSFIHRAEVIREKGTNRSAFFRGEVNKYGWVDIGSSFLPSEMLAAFLFGQLEKLEIVQSKRIAIYERYYNGLSFLNSTKLLKLPYLPEYASNNAHMFYLVCENIKMRSRLIAYLKQNGVMAVFHYLSLHSSEFFKHKHDGRLLVNSDFFSDCLLRLPMYYNLELEAVDYIVELITRFINEYDLSNAR